MVAVIDRSDDDGTISADRWQLVKVKLSGGFLSILRELLGPLPSISDGGWHQSHVKLMVCADQRSRDLYIYTSSLSAG